MSQSYLIDLSSTKTFTSAELYNDVYKSQLLVIFQTSFSVLVGFLMSQYIYAFLGNVSKKMNNLMKVILYLFTLIIMIIISAHIFTINKIKSERDKISSEYN